MGTPDETREKWAGWINVQWAELNMAFLQREMVHEVTEALDRQREGRWFAGMLGRMYVAYQVMAVRRLADQDDRTMSLRLLLEQVLNNPQFLSREVHVRRWLDANPDLDWAERTANGEYDQWFGEGSLVPPDQVVFQDIKRLKADTRIVKEYGDKVIAHLSRQKLSEPLTLDRLEKAVDDVVDLFRHWSIIIAGSDHYVGAAVDGDWRLPFAQPLMPQGPATSPGRA